MWLIIIFIRAVISAKNRHKAICLQLQFTTALTKQLKCYRLEISEIQAMKFVKYLRAWPNQKSLNANW